MATTTVRYTMCAVRLSDGRYLVRCGHQIIRVNGYGNAEHYQDGPAEACRGGELAARILRRDARRAGIEGAAEAEIVAVDNDNQATMRVLDV